MSYVVHFNHLTLNYLESRIYHKRFCGNLRFANRYKVLNVTVAVLLAIYKVKTLLLCVSMSTVWVLSSSHSLLTLCCEPQQTAVTHLIPDPLDSPPIRQDLYTLSESYIVLNKTLFIMLNSQHQDVLFCLGNFSFSLSIWYHRGHRKSTLFCSKTVQIAHLCFVY